MASDCAEDCPAFLLFHYSHTSFYYSEFVVYMYRCSYNIKSKVGIKKNPEPYWVLPGVLLIVLLRLKGRVGGYIGIQIDSVCFSSPPTHAVAPTVWKVFWIQTVLAINAFYSKQDPMELVWVAAFLKMSSEDKRVCQCAFVRLYLCMCVYFSVQNNAPLPNMKGAAAHWI